MRCDAGGSRGSKAPEPACEAACQQTTSRSIVSLAGFRVLRLVGARGVNHSINGTLSLVAQASSLSLSLSLSLPPSLSPSLPPSLRIWGCGLRVVSRHLFFNSVSQVTGRSCPRLLFHMHAPPHMTCILICHVSPYDKYPASDYCSLADVALYLHPFSSPPLCQPTTRARSHTKSTNAFITVVGGAGQAVQFRHT